MVGRFNIMKMSILPKAICRVSAIPVKIPMAYFVELEQKFQKFTRNHTHTKKEKTNSLRSIKKKEQSGGYHTN